MRKSRVCFPLSGVSAVYPIKTGKTVNMTRSILYKVGIRIGNRAVDCLPTLFSCVVYWDVKQLKDAIFGGDANIDFMDLEMRDAVHYMD